MGGAHFEGCPGAFPRLRVSAQNPGLCLCLRKPLRWVLDKRGWDAFEPQLSITPTPSPVNLSSQMLQLISVPCLPPVPLEEMRLAMFVQWQAARKLGGAVGEGWAPGRRVLAEAGCLFMVPGVLSRLLVPRAAWDLLAFRASNVIETTGPDPGRLFHPSHGHGFLFPSSRGQRPRGLSLFSYMPLSGLRSRLRGRGASGRAALVVEPGRSALGGAPRDSTAGRGEGLWAKSAPSLGKHSPGPGDRSGSGARGQDFGPGPRPIAEFELSSSALSPLCSAPCALSPSPSTGPGAHSASCPDPV